ncbi:hypothetical protein FA15DRAFT_695481 [Coprinopsis marcescibilis]|uniref:Nephrocystin 3-like N-terminal domain-containing protein n=1 Tax=Coprinopsis marcescibilis TaxID=230819 RepID=A0A5C3KQU2_COPMA|nr:hypothetical protein FA15DRAFT_695481 [Coprinopsis marcescibilis]
MYARSLSSTATSTTVTSLVYAPDALPIPYPEKTYKSRLNVPGYYQSFIADPYWKDYISCWLIIARDTYKRALANDHLLVKETAELTDAFARIYEMAQAYDEILRKPKGLRVGCDDAKKIATHITTLVQRFEITEQVSAERARKRQEELSAIHAETGGEKSSESSKGVKVGRQDAKKIASHVNKLVKEFEKTEQITSYLADSRQRELKALQESRGTYDKLLDRRLEEFSFLYAYRRPPPCNVADRAEAMRRLIGWLETVDTTKPIFWLHGEPNCGKSVFVHHIFQRLHYHEAVASTFRFNKHTDQATLGEIFISNLITDIGHYLGPAFRTALHEIAPEGIFENNRFLKRSLDQQLVELLVPAFDHIPEAKKKPLLIIIDGIERCDYDALINLFGVVEIAIQKLPICFIIVSRPEDYLQAYLGNGGILGRYVESAFLPPLPLESVNRPESSRESIDTYETLVTPAPTSFTWDVAVEPTDSPRVGQRDIDERHILHSNDVWRS